jgi:hypothetical protein
MLVPRAAALWPVIRNVNGVIAGGPTSGGVRPILSAI